MSPPLAAGRTCWVCARVKEEKEKVSMMVFSRLSGKGGRGKKRVKGRRQIVLKCDYELELI